MVYGAPKHGKTVLAATISEKFPDKPGKERVVLDDVLYLQCDTNGIESLLGLQIVPYVIDLAVTETDYLKYKQIVMNAMKEAVAAVKSQGIKYIVIDTLSTLDATMTALLSKVKDGQQLYGQLYADMREIFNTLKSAPASVIALAHVKVAHSLIGDSASTTQRKMASELPGAVDFTPQITGKAADLYKGACSGLFALRTIQAKGKPPERKIITNTYLGYEAGHRFQGLDVEEEAHLGKLLTKANTHRG